VRELPPGWAWTKLGHAVPDRPKISPASIPDLQFIGMEHVEAHTMRLLGTVPAMGMKSAAVHFQGGDVLYGRLRPYLNKVLRPSFEGLCSAEFIVFSPAPAIDQRYLQYVLNSAPFVSFASHLNAGDRPRVDFEQIGDFELPLPPLLEQGRIIGEIDKQFIRLDAGVFSLYQAQRKLAVCRRAVLQAAIQGRLNNAIESLRQWPHVLLGDLAEASVNAVTDGPFGSNLKTEHYTDAGPRVIRLQNIGDGKFIDQRACISPAHFARLQKHAVEPGDLLIAALGNELPRACIAPDSLGPAIVKADCIRFRPAAAQVSARYLCYALNSDAVRQATRKLVHGVGRPRLNLSEIKSIQIPLPPINDQMEIVEAVDDDLSLIDAVEDTVRTSLKKAAGLRQAILKRAFEGKLVPQDPSGEPASALLERIRAARVQTPARRAPRKREVHV
jgi:type I restriction enzyme, S subunit